MYLKFFAVYYSSEHWIAQETMNFVNPILKHSDALSLSCVTFNYDLSVPLLTELLQTTYTVAREYSYIKYSEQKHLGNLELSEEVKCCRSSWHFGGWV